MADDRDPSQQTEDPTQKRLDEAREHGDVIKSPEVSTFVLLLGGAIAIALFGASTAKGLAQALRIFLEQPEQISMDPSDIMGLARHTMTIVAGLLAPVFAVMMAAAIGGHVIQSRPSISFDKIRPDFSKLSLLPSLRRMFGLDGLTNLVKGLAKILLVGFAVWTQI